MQRGILNGQTNILQYQSVNRKLTMCANILRIRKLTINRKLGRMNTMNLLKSMDLKELRAKTRFSSNTIFPTINGGVSQSRNCSFVNYYNMI